jgi:hypothetical protein
MFALVKYQGVNISVIKTDKIKSISILQKKGVKRKKQVILINLNLTR